jgi:hypothetical protein
MVCCGFVKPPAVLRSAGQCCAIRHNAMECGACSGVQCRPLEYSAGRPHLLAPTAQSWMAGGLYQWMAENGWQAVVRCDFMKPPAGRGAPVLCCAVVISPAPCYGFQCSAVQCSPRERSGVQCRAMECGEMECGAAAIARRSSLLGDGRGRMIIDGD